MPQDWKTVALNIGAVAWLYSLWKHKIWRGKP